MMNEAFDNAISVGRLLWIMDDESFDKLLAITQAHLRLVKEHGDKETLPERREAIKAEIEALRAERVSLLNDQTHGRY